jgi:Rieske Fe-S protein
METLDQFCPARRCVLAAAAVGASAALAGCSTYGGTSGGRYGGGQSATPAQPQAAGSSTPAAAGSPSAAAGAGNGAPADALAVLADIPVGGGVVLAAQKLVLTRPTAATLKGFSAVCTHAGCTVSDVTGGTINCPCHGSKYAIADGSVVGGPAPRSLPPITVRVQGGSVVRA